MRSATTHGKIARRSRRIVTDTPAAQSERQQGLRTPTPPRGDDVGGKRDVGLGQTGGKSKRLVGGRRSSVGAESETGVAFGMVDSPSVFRSTRVMCSGRFIR